MIHKKLIISEDVINDIVDESNRHENVETGGLLFGKFIEEYIIILKLIHFSTNAKRTQVYFEMDEDFAINITKQMEKNNLAYPLLRTIVSNLFKVSDPSSQTNRSAENEKADRIKKENGFDHIQHEEIREELERDTKEEKLLLSEKE